MTSSRSENRAELIKAYDNLLAARKEAIGRVSDNFKTTSTSIESKSDIDDIDAKYGKAIRKTSIRDRVLNIFKKDPDALVTELLDNIKILNVMYKRQTVNRLQYGLLSPLATCDETELSKYMGAPKTDHGFDLTWRVKFQQLISSGDTIGSLELAGITQRGLMCWWYADNCDHAIKETYVWKDVRTLSVRLVCALDKKDSTSTIHGTLLETITSLATKLKAFTLSLVRLIYLRSEDIEQIVPLYELLVPLIYAFSVLLSFETKDQKSIGVQVARLLETYSNVIAEQKDELVKKLSASEEMRRYERPDRDSCHLSQIRPLSLNRDYEGDDFKAIISRLAFDRLKSFGLDEIKLDFSVLGSVGNGSFSNVCSHPAEAGTVLYAVKYFKCKGSDLERTKERLLREAHYWKRISHPDHRHKNVQPLLGICMNPAFTLPGLVSPLRKFTLQKYLEIHQGKIGVQEKLFYLLEIAEGLTHLHLTLGIAHGDVRPANILLDEGEYGPDGRLKAVLNDFGVSHSDGYSYRNKQTSMQHTNDEYLAPELLEKQYTSRKSSKSKDLSQVTPEGDIYAFGCTFFEAMYDKTPFHYEKRRDLWKVKLDGGLPALENEVQEQHWKFLVHVWNLKADKRPLANAVRDKIVDFITTT